MAKEYKPRAATKKKSSGGTLLGIFIGLILGLCIAVGVAWYINKTPIPFLTKAGPPEKAVMEPGKGMVKPDEKTTQQVESRASSFIRSCPGPKSP